MPAQMCQFHPVAIVIRTLRKNINHMQEEELKSIIKTLGAVLDN